MANLKRIARSTGVYTNGLARQMKTALFVIMFVRQSTRNVNSDFFCCAKTKAIGSQFSQTMDAKHIAKVVQARDRVERWPCTLVQVPGCYWRTKRVANHSAPKLYSDVYPLTRVKVPVRQTPSNPCIRWEKSCRVVSSNSQWRYCLSPLTAIRQH